MGQDCAQLSDQLAAPSCDAKHHRFQLPCRHCVMGTFQRNTSCCQASGMLPVLAHTANKVSVLADCQQMHNGASNSNIAHVEYAMKSNCQCDRAGERSTDTLTPVLQQHTPQAFAAVSHYVREPPPSGSKKKPRCFSAGHSVVW